MYNLRYLALFIVFCIIQLTAKSQTAVTVTGTGVNAFLQGNYLEVGVSYCGTYGTEIGLVVPPGFHPRTVPLDGIGFVADEGRDGWTIGTPDYCGDYFLPGTPVEGWGLEFDGNTYINTDRCTVNDVTGSNTSTTYTAGTLLNIWEGNIAGMHIKQESYFPDNALYLVTKVYLTNTTSTAMSNIIYARNLDPDNDQPISGDFTTLNTVVSQPNLFNCDALVSAVGLNPGCYLGLGARSQNARVGVGGFSTIGPLADYYTAIRDTTTGHVSTADEAISLMFNWPSIAPGQTVNLAFAYVLSASDLSAALESTGGVQVFSDSIDITNALSDTICPDDTLELVLNADTSYDWTWSPSISISSLTGNKVKVFPHTTTTYTANGINGPCGSIVRQITIIVNPNIKVNAGPDQSLCLGSSATINATHASVFNWTPVTTLNTNTGATVIATPIVNTTYYVSSNCGLDTINISVVPNYSINLATDTAICLGNSTPLFFNIVPAFSRTFTWSNASTLSNATLSNPIATPTGATTYALHIVSAAGCAKDTFIHVGISGYPPIVNIEGDSLFCFHDTNKYFVTAFSPLCADYNYSVEPYAPITGTGNSVLLDYDMVKRVPLNFHFNFFCSSYDSITINDKGYLTFLNEGSAWVGPDIIPNVADPNSMIAFAWNNFDPVNGGTIDYRTIGVAPNRKFIVNYNNQVQFGTTDTVVSCQVILYETTNNIEIHTAYMNNLYATQGLEDNTGSNFIVVPSRNATNINITSPECIRFTPNNLIGTTTYSWTPASIMSSPTTNETNVFSNTPITISVLVSNNGCNTTATRTIGVDTFLHILDYSNDTTVCAGSDIPLFIVASSDTSSSSYVSCSHYNANSITYNRVTGSGTNVLLYNPTYTAIDNDNGVSRALPIRFHFPFYCNVYDSLYITANGYVTFTKPTAGATLPQTLPDNAVANNLIAVDWDDYDLDIGGDIDYRTIGTAPNRRMIINFTDLETASGGSYKGQLILNEIDSSITINHTDVRNLGNSTCGVEDINGIDATEAPGRNNVFWNLTAREAWNFKPGMVYNLPRVITYYWDPSVFVVNPYSDSTTAFVNSNTNYNVYVNDGYCLGTAAVNASIIPTPLPTITGNDTICMGDTTTLNVSGGINYIWNTGDTTTSISISPTSSAYYLVLALNANNCFSVNDVFVQVNTFSEIPTMVAATPNYGCMGSPITLSASGYTAGTGASPIWWTDSLGTGTNVGTGDTVTTLLTSNNYYIRLEGTCNAVEASVNTTIGAPLNVILATDPITNSTNYCDEGAWTYYEHPTIPNKYIFAIKWGLANDTIKPLANVSIYNEGATIFSEAVRTGGIVDAAYLMKRYWNVDLAGASLNEPVAIKFYYDTSEIVAINNDRDTHIVTLNTMSPGTYFNVPMKWFKTIGIPFDPTLINDGNNFSFPFVELHPSNVGTESSINYVQFDSILSFSGGGAGVGISPFSGVTLPVSLINLKATPINNEYIRVSWTTLTEINNKGFEVYRSIDGIHFEKIAYIDGHDNTSTQNDYYFNDLAVNKNQVYYYKIKQIDIDNKEVYTNVVAAIINELDGIKISEFYPNPSNQLSYINVLVTNNTNINIDLYDALGQKVSSMSTKLLKGNNTVPFNTSHLSSGVYMANILLDNKSYFKYLLKY